MATSMAPAVTTTEARISVFWRRLKEVPVLGVIQLRLRASLPLGLAKNPISFA